MEILAIQTPVKEIKERPFAPSVAKRRGLYFLYDIDLITRVQTLLGWRSTLKSWQVPQDISCHDNYNN
jgi:hypothetical protein